MPNLPRCTWCQGDPLYQHYHDTEWGVPCHDDRLLHEFLVLESAQAGLAWITILRKRQAYRKAFADFDPREVAHYAEADVDRLMANPGIVRNRLKIESAIGNARVFLAIQQRYGSFANYFWRFSDGQPLLNRWRRPDQVPAKTALSDRISRETKTLGFRFFGSTICYAYMQATGMVNDHLLDCFRYEQCRTG